MVTTPDGVPLAVREVGPEDAPLTVVFAHGFCLRMGAFYFQRARLTEQWGSQVRMVFYDQRGHGQSGEASPETYTVPQLGQDLETVLAVMAPARAGGARRALDGRHDGAVPRPPVSRSATPPASSASALISSAAEGVSRSPLGEILKNPVLEAARFAVRYAPKTVHRTRGAATLGDRAGAAGGVLRRREDQPERRGVLREDDARHADRHPGRIPARARGARRDRRRCPTLAKVPTLIVCGDRDLLTPKEYSEAMAAALPKSELVIVGGAGHLVQLEQPEIVDDALVRLVERATPSKLVAMTRRLRERVRNHG